MCNVWFSFAIVKYIFIVYNKMYSQTSSKFESDDVVMKILRVSIPIIIQKLTSMSQQTGNVLTHVKIAPKKVFEELKNSQQLQCDNCTQKMIGGNILGAIKKKLPSIPVKYILHVLSNAIPIIYEIMEQKKNNK